MSYSGPNRAVVTAAYDALASGNDAEFMARLASNVEWIVPGPPEHPSTGTHVGKDALLTMFERFGAVAELQELGIEGVVGEGDPIVVLGRERWRVRVSGREFETIWANVVSVSDGLITRVTVYADTHNEMSAFAGE